MNPREAAFLVKPILLLLLSILLWGSLSASAQISPGALSRAHNHLEGVTKCTSCHNLSARSFKCLDCHTEIQNRVAAGTGFHARAYRPSVGTIDCANCHKEHRGPNVALIDLDRTNFDHKAKTGFALKGRHLQLSCGKCHTAAKIASSLKSDIKIKDVNHSFLGLRTECTACHSEPHQGQLGTSCTQCHTQDHWRPAANFNHSSTKFPLTGMHQNVSCIKCHSQTGSGNPAKTTSASSENSGAAGSFDLRFKGLKFDGCQNCHDDPHHGAFQELKLDGKCEGCHNTGGFKSNLPGKNFNHNLASFKLDGKHSSLACTNCHEKANFQRAIPHAQCQNCHQDPHHGQFAAKANGGVGKDCSACHSPAGFKPTLFDRNAHQSASFPLEGKHLEANCNQCHLPDGVNAVFRSGKLTCLACHVDPHAGQFAAAPYSNQCNQCHTVAGFQKTTFSLDRHGQTKFALTGRHAEVECTSCHKPLQPSVEGGSAALLSDSAKGGDAPLPSTVLDAKAADNARRQFHFDSLTCSNCHKDPHQFSASANWTCETCHQPQGWKSLRPFDHDRTKFKLVGSHREKDGKPVACISCHRGSTSPTDQAPVTVPVFASSESHCASCHNNRDPHGGQFNEPANFRKDCSSCHTPDSWDGKSFHHDQARFALDVAHRAVECVNCHKQQQLVQGKQVRIFRNTPKDCLNCH